MQEIINILHQNFLIIKFLLLLVLRSLSQLHLHMKFELRNCSSINDRSHQIFSLKMFEYILLENC